MATTGLVLYEASKFTLWASNDGSAWHEMIGASAVTPSGGEADSREVDAFKRSARVTGSIGIPTYEVDAVAPALGTTAWDLVFNAYINSTVLQFRAEFDEVEVAALVAGRTAALAATGIVTFAGTGEHPRGSIIEGQALKIGNAYYVVDTVSDASPPVIKTTHRAAVAAGDYSLVVPRRRQTIANARVGVAGNFTVATGAELASALTINPQTRPTGYELAPVATVAA